MDRTQLQQQLLDIEEQKKKLDERKLEIRQQIIDDIRQTIQQFAITEDELFSETRMKVKAKYKNPNGPEVWSGRGKKPAWFAEALAGGLTEDKMRI